MVPACEIKLLSIWENALHGIFSHAQQKHRGMNESSYLQMVTYTQ